MRIAGAVLGGTFLVACLCCVFVHDTHALKGDLLATSNFVSGLQDWTVQGSVDSKEGLQRDSRFGFLKVKDEGDYTWYFASPENFFAADKASMYNSNLTYFIQHMEWQLGFKTGQYDAKLVCTPKGLSMGVSGVVKDGVGAAMHSIILNEKAGWEFITPKLQKYGGDKRKAPTAEEFIKCLSRLTSIQVRGGYFEGPERTALKWMRVTQGAVDTSASSGMSGASSQLASPVGDSSCVSEKETVVRFQHPGVCDGAKLNDKEHLESNAIDYYCNQAIGDYGTSAASVLPTGPWIVGPTNHTFVFKSLPQICTTARLTVELQGRLHRHMLYPDDVVDVFGEHGDFLGRLFEDNNRVQTMQDGGAFTDTIPISAEQMAGMTVDGQMLLTFSVNRAGREVFFQSLEVRYFHQACYTRQISTGRFVNSEFEVSSGMQKPMEQTIRLPVPSTHDANIGGDAILQITVEGDVGYDDFVQVIDENGVELGRVFEGYTARSTSRIAFVGLLDTVDGATKVTLRSGDGASSANDFYNGKFIRVVRGKGIGQERRIADYVGASREITLDTQWDQWDIPTPQSTIEIVNVEQYDLDSPYSGSRKTWIRRDRRSEWIKIPRNVIASQIKDGAWNVKLAATDPGNTLVRARFSPVRLVFPLRRCHMDDIVQGEFINRRLYRPSRQIVEFPVTAPAPAGDATLFVETFWQMHTAYTADSGATRRDQNNDFINLGEDEDHPQQLYPHGFATLRVLSQDNGEHLGFLYLKDYSQYDQAHSFVTDMKIPMERLQTFVRQGSLQLTIIVPPGTGVLKVQRMTISYPVL